MFELSKEDDRLRRITLRAGCDNEITNMLTIVRKAENSNLEIFSNYTLTMKETKKLIQALDDNCAIVETVGKL